MNITSVESMKNKKLKQCQMFIYSNMYYSNVMTYNLRSLFYFTIIEITTYSMFWNTSNIFDPNYYILILKREIETIKTIISK